MSETTSQNRERVQAILRRRKALGIPLRGRPGQRLPANPYPRRIAEAYLGRIQRALLGPLHVALQKRVVPVAQRLAAQVDATRPRHDAAGDDPLDEVLDAVFEDMQERFERSFEDLIRPVVNGVVETSRATASKQFAAGIGIDVVGNPDLGPAIEAFTRENVALIKSIPRQAHDDLHAQLLRGIAKGFRPEEIAELVEDRYTVVGSRAALIARDQTSKFNGKLAELRQQAAGLSRYTWRTARDNRVRDEHAALEGQVFRWADAPEDGHPGEAVNCRCYAEPYVADLLGPLDD